MHLGFTRPPSIISIAYCFQLYLSMRVPAAAFAMHRPLSVPSFGLEFGHHVDQTLKTLSSTKANHCSNTKPEL